MIKLQISYENELEKEKVIKTLSTVTEIKKISEPYKNGKFYRVYVDVK